jgi:hypothetical protein
VAALFPALFPVLLPALLPALPPAFSPALSPGLLAAAVTVAWQVTALAEPMSPSDAEAAGDHEVPLVIDGTPVERLVDQATSDMKWAKPGRLSFAHSAYHQR